MPRSPAPFRLLAACALLLGSGLAQAQYSWIGENGVRHFSDRPPPPSIPPNKILKAPGRGAVVAPAPPSDTTEPAPAQGKAAPGWAERELEYKERMKKRAEQEKKDAQQAERQREIAQRCEWARTARAQVESGVRISNVDPNGAPGFASDAERAAQLERARKILAECP